jgi:signal transduction histidine kinase
VESKGDVTAAIDIRQMERAIYNLLLNGCQSARQSLGRREVSVSLNGDETMASVTITDSGLGVAEGIRENLFDPFVSLGKQKGTGLGLTLAWSVAREHDGSVEVVSSRPGEAVFRLTVSRVVSGTKSNTTNIARSTQLTS